MAQSYSAGQSNDFAYTLSVISKEVRKEPFSSIAVSESGKVLSIGGVERFRQQGTELVTNEGQVLTEGVDDFAVELSATEKSVAIVLKSPEKNTRQKSI